MTARLDLPDGPRGRVLAAALTLVVALVAWFAIAAPLLDWYAARAETLRERETLAGRTAQLIATLPDLRRQATAAAGDRTRPGSLLAGDSDAIAAAMLQEEVQAMARGADMTLASVETLPSTQAGSLRRIGLRIAVTAPMPRVVALLQAIARGTPRLLAADVTLQARTVADHPSTPDLSATMTVYGFRAGPGQTATAGGTAGGGGTGP